MQSSSGPQISPPIATVDAAGLVTGVAAGSVTIKAASDETTAKVTVQVVRDAVRKLSIKPATADGRTRRCRALRGSRRRERNPPVRWSVTGSGAAIYPDGAFVAEKAGTYVVTAKQRPEHSASASQSQSVPSAQCGARGGSRIPCADARSADVGRVDHRPSRVPRHGCRQALRLRHCRSGESQAARYAQSRCPPDQ